MAIKAGWIQAPEPGVKEPKARCCARCKTPYNCGNTDCKCHEKGEKK